MREIEDGEHDGRRSDDGDQQGLAASEDRRDHEEEHHGKGDAQPRQRGQPAPPAKGHDCQRKGSEQNPQLGAALVVSNLVSQVLSGIRGVVHNHVVADGKAGGAHP